MRLAKTEKKTRASASRSAKAQCAQRRFCRTSSGALEAFLRPHRACKILLVKAACMGGGVCLMEDAGRRRFWQADGGRLLPLDAAFGEGSSWEIARAVALWGDRWETDPSLLGDRQRAALRRRASRLVRSVEKLASERVSLSQNSRVAMPWVWYEIAGGIETRMVGSAWLRAGDSLQLRGALEPFQVGGLWASPDRIGRVFAPDERFLFESMSRSMGRLLSCSTEELGNLLLWLPREVPPREKEAFLGSVVWVLSLRALSASSDVGLSSVSRIPLASSPVVGGWPSCRRISMREEGSLRAHAEFMSKREWALALMSYAEVSSLMRGV